MKELRYMDSINHFHRVYHFVGGLSELNEISVRLLGTTLENLPL